MSEISNNCEIDFNKIYRDSFCLRLGISSEQLTEIEKAIQHLCVSINEICEVLCRIIGPAIDSLAQCLEDLQFEADKTKFKDPRRRIRPPHKMGDSSSLLLDRRVYIKRYRNAIRGGL